ncbi:ribonuclease H-like domain-containing protein, partial [Tanacetum coccineum]
LSSYLLNGKSPFELVFEKCVLIGFSTTKKAYKVYSLESKLVFYSRDIEFYETVFYFKINSSLQPVEENHDDNINNLNFFNEKHFDDQTSFRPNDDGRVNFASNDKSNVFPCSKSTQTSDECEDNIATSMGNNTSSEGTVPSSSDLNAQDLPKNISHVQPDLRRSGRNSKLPAKFNDYVVGSSRKYGLEKYVTYSNLSKTNYCFSTTLNKSSEPTTYVEAVKNPNWIEETNNEIEALNRYNTWTICDLSPRRKVVESKWLWKIKYKPIGATDRYKARLDLFQLDINNAFLYGDLFEDVYMTLPLLTMALIENGFVQSKFDYSLFIKKSHKVFTALRVYVDHIVITVLDNMEGSCLSQRKYCLELLHEYGLLVAKHVDTPLLENTTLNHIETDDDPLLVSICMLFPYDNDMYKGQDIRDKLQAICDNLDITVRGRRKK